MKQQLKETVIYQPNDEVRVTVSNTPVTETKTGRIFFKQSVTFKVERGWEENKLKFGNDDDLRKFLDDINLVDPQQELPL